MAGPIRARLARTLSSTSTTLLISGTALLLIALTAVTGGIWQMRKEALGDAQRSLAVLGTAVAEQTTRSLQGADLVIEELRREFEARGWSNPEQFRTGLGTEAIFRQLAARSDVLPQVNALTVIGADGKLINFSRAWPIPPTDLSDRAYFKRLQQEDVGHSILTLPMRNRGDGGYTAYLVRRVNGPGGQFLGLVLAALDLNYYREFYRILVKDSGNGVVLLRSDGVVLASYPEVSEVASETPAGSPWFAAAKTPGGGLFTRDEAGSDAQMVSVHPLSSYPMVINVTANERSLLGPWRRLALAMALGSMVVAVFVVLLLRALRNQFSRLEHSESSLAAQNRTLEATQLELEAQAEAYRASQIVLAEQTTALGITLGHMDQGILMVDGDGTVKVCNKRLMDMLELPEQLMQTRPQFTTVVAYQSSMGEFSATPEVAALAKTLGQPGFAPIAAEPTRSERIRPNGTVLDIVSIPLADGGMVRTFTDVTQRQTSEKQIRFLAHHDGLTELVNRSMFAERLAAAIVTADREGQGVAVLYIDLDGFKLVNDTYGHAVGDRLLIAVADRLRLVAEGDTVARMGGDEFAVIHPLRGDPAALEELAQRMLAAIVEPYRLGDLQCRISLSIGIARYPAHAQNGEDLLRDADIALYRAKAAGKANYRVFDATMDERRQELFRLEQDLGLAIARGELFLEYQPIVDTRTLQPMGFEALLRWRHRTHGLIGPGEFIGIAETSGLIVGIGAWVLRTACQQAVHWPGNTYLSVNLSPVQFARGNLVDNVQEALSSSGLDPTRLTLEITEGILLEDTDTVKLPMTTLRNQGVRFSLDDFGTAHSGLAYLQRFSFDVIKVDKSFVQMSGDQTGARAIVSAVLAIGAAFSVQVVAEGVETQEQLDTLRQLGCGLVQGYLTGRPATHVSFGT